MTSVKHIILPISLVSGVLASRTALVDFMDENGRWLPNAKKQRDNQHNKDVSKGFQSFLKSEKTLVDTTIAHGNELTAHMFVSGGYLPGLTDRAMGEWIA